VYGTEYYSTILLLGDNVFEDSLSGIIEEYGKRDKTTIGVYDVVNLELAKRYGIVEVDSDGRVSRFEEKPLNPRATLASVGMYIFSPDDLGRLSGYLGSDNPMDAPGNFV
jgi:glucose-1-phosphate thymidylyltransferase